MTADLDGCTLGSFGVQSNLGRGFQEACLRIFNMLLLESLSAYVELISINALQFDCSRALSGLHVIDVAYSMRGKVRIPILQAGYLVLSTQAFELERCLQLSRGTAPFIEANCILDKK